ncbi:histidine kinase [Streptomyces sp. NBC_00237]|uniref:sensor histidine kinase n=1 Tax=Streptomyces sp. NBC_00237 TaxID=2975687 RepID=UPI002255861D|nr:histidine kinase [Streptomyces sp. NBC_00237]MCX5203886.1 histidine kinase [Streptomyces sp. NBC_00237]
MGTTLRAHPWAADIGVALLVQLVVSVPWLIPRPAGSSPATLLAYGLTALTVLPLVWRRRAPVTVLAAVLCAQVLYGVAADGPGQTLPYTSMVALYSLAACTPSPLRQVTGGLTLAVAAVSVVGRGRDDWLRELMLTLVVFAASYAFGRLTHTRQAYTRAVEERARAVEERSAELERANRIEAEQAAARERARIAREMHDILSHAVSIMVVQAEAGPVAVRVAPERAEAAFDAISETGREAMTQLRQMLGLLRDAPSDPDVSRGPQPTIGELPRLVERVGRSGLSVAYETTGRPHSLPPVLEATAYRIVQEALTNIVKHAHARHARVRLHYQEQELTLTITDDGRGRPGPAARTAGHGLIGIQERAAAHGGSVTAGPGPDGTGFSVRAVLLITPAEASGVAS